MLTIPANLDTWHANDITRWLSDVAEDQDVTDVEFADAQAAGYHAIIGEPLGATDAVVLPFTRHNGGHRRAR